MPINELLVILLLVLLNGVFAGAEIALVSLRKTRMDKLAEGGSSRARAVLALRANPERFLATVQVGITVVGAAAAALGGASLATRVEPWLGRLPWLENHAEALSLTIVVAGVSYLSIVVGELVPKSLALRGSERYALWVAKPLLALSWLTRPVVWFLSASANLVLKPFGDQTTFTEARHSAEELRTLVEEARDAGTIEPEAGEIASRALELPELSAVDVMVPRQDVILLPKQATQEEIQRAVLEHGYSRFPVYDGSIDNIIGYIAAKDILGLVWEHRPVVLDDVMRVPYFVPESKRMVALMNEMRERRVPFAIVVDEHGGMSGIATMEDLVEELVGDIFSEHVRDSKDNITRQSDDSVIVAGTMPIRDANRVLGIELPEDGKWNTVAGLCLSLAGRVPTVGQTFPLDNGLELEIVEASVRRVRAVRIRQS